MHKPIPVRMFVSMLNVDDEMSMKLATFRAMEYSNISPSRLLHYFKFSSIFMKRVTILKTSGFLKQKLRINTE